MATLTDVFAQAERDFAERRYLDALRGYLALTDAAPRFARARYRIGDALLNLGDRARAKDVYKALAWHHLKSGQPLLGLAATKMLLALDPGYGDLLPIFAELYGSSSERVGDAELSPAPALPEVLAPPLPTLDGPLLVEAAARRAADTDAITVAPARLPAIPLFSHLSEEAFGRVLTSLRLRRHADGEAIVREGDSGDSFFILADGRVSVSKLVDGRPATLAHLHPGAVFGEMALVSHAPRAATVSALGEVDLLELSRSALEAEAEALESVRQALKKFTRGRFLANLAATSPIFRPLDKPERRALMARFRADKVFAGDVVIEEGEPGRGLYLVLRGELRVTRRQGAAEQPLAVLKSGDLFGEMSLLRGAPASATVTALGPCELLHLSREEFSEAVAAFPEVRAALAEISEERLRAQREQEPPELITDDDLVML
jgi:CRP-like cAMP-binding protein